MALGAQGRDLRDLVRIRLKLLVLALLAIKPSHGYELSRTIEEVTLGAVKAGPGSLYPLLRELVEEGLVEETEEADGRRVRKVYRLTEKGLSALAEAIDVARSVLSNVLSLLDAAARAVKGGARGCVPREVVEYLESLEQMARAMARQLGERLCQ